MAVRDAEARGNLRARQARRLQPADINWAELSPEAWSDDEKVAIMYWWALLSNFDSSGPAVFARATIHAWETHEEDPVRKCFFSITRDETNHEETCQRVIQRLVPNGPQGFAPKSELQRVALNNIGWLYHNGGRYWTGYNRAIDRYPLAVIFTSFMNGRSGVLDAVPRHGARQRRIRCSAISSPRSDATRRAISRSASTCSRRSGRDLPTNTKLSSPKQLRAGFVFLSMVLWEPPGQFWDLPGYFLNNHRILLRTAREAGLGILTFEQQADNWRLAIARVRKLVERWDIQFPAIPELDIEGVDVGDITAEDIIPVF